MNAVKAAKGIPMNDTTKPTLKHCPFCGEMPDERHCAADGGDDWIVCLKCGVEQDTPDEWNTRPEPTLKPCPKCGYTKPTKYDITISKLDPNVIEKIINDLEETTGNLEKVCGYKLVKYNQEPTEAQIEDLAALEHKQWAHWTKYMLNNMTPDNILRWHKQIKTPYHLLSEEEKESDRKWARIALQAAGDV